MLLLPRWTLSLRSTKPIEEFHSFFLKF